MPFYHFSSFFIFLKTDQVLAVNKPLCKFVSGSYSVSFRFIPFQQLSEHDLLDLLDLMIAMISVRAF
jgi:hypothetical protein